MNNSVNILADGVESNDESFLFYLVAFVWRHRAALLGGALIGGALGLAVAFTRPVQWGAVVQLQVAQLGGVGPVEPPLRVVERLGRASFIEDVARRMGVSIREPKGIFFGSLKAKLEKSDLVGVSVRGATPEVTASFADAVVKELASAHSIVAKPTIERWHKELDEIEMELKQANTESARLALLLGENQNAVTDKNISRYVLASNILLARESNLRAFRERRRALQEQLSPERTFTTTPLGRIEVSKQPVSPNKQLIGLAGLVIGLCIGALLSVLWHTGTRKSAQINTD